MDNKNEERDIYKIFEDKIYQKEIQSEIQPQVIMKESNNNNYHPQSKLINKYFNSNNNK